MKVGRQIAMFVEKGGETFLAHWIEYPARSASRTHLAVLHYVPALIPRTKVAIGLLESRYDLSLAEARSWLLASGYRIVREME
jgi:hypothetical protein